MTAGIVEKLMISSPLNYTAEEVLDSSNCRASWSSKLTPEAVVAQRTLPVSVESNKGTVSGVEFTLKDGLSLELIGLEGLLEEEKERIRLSKVGKKKDFCHRERVDGRFVNIVEGIELYTNVFNTEEQKKIVASVSSYQKLGQKNQLLGMYT